MTTPARVLIVEARYYADIADNLATGAIQLLDDANIAYDRIMVPGVFEVPAAIRFAIHAMDQHANTTHYSGFMGMGCVIRGETDHYEHICREASRAIMDLSMIHCAAIGFGILTCETMEQARVRASVTDKNKGAEVAEACIRMMQLKQQFHLAQN